MSNFRECLTLYRFDVHMTDAQLEQTLTDAIERDVESKLRDHFNGTTAQDASLAIPPLSPAAAYAAVASSRESQPMTPEQAAAYLLEQHRSVVTTIEAIGKAIEGLNELDDKRATDVAALTDAVEFLGRRVDLRAEECTALGKRIENLFRATSRPTLVEPA